VSVQSVDVIYHYEPEGYWAESPDLAGFYAAGLTLGEVRSMVFEGVATHLGPLVTIRERFPDAVSVLSHVVAPSGASWFASAAVVLDDVITVTAPAGRLAYRVLPSDEGVAVPTKVTNVR